MSLSLEPGDLVNVTRRRPRSLAEVAGLGRDAGEISAFTREFLDEFYTEGQTHRRAAMLAVEPPLTGIAQTDAYFAAMAEHLARRFGLPVPGWTEAASRFLKRAYFPSGLESLKAYCLVHSPVAFRRRIIFVDEDPLYRPRRDKAGFGE